MCNTFSSKLPISYMEVKLIIEHDVKQTKQACIQTIDNNVCLISSHDDYISIIDFINPPRLIKKTENGILCKDNQQNVYVYSQQNQTIYVLSQNQLQEYKKINTNGQQVLLFDCVQDNVFIVTNSAIINVTKNEETIVAALSATVSGESIIFEGNDGLLHDFKNNQITDLKGESINGLRYIVGTPSGDLLFLATYNTIYVQNIKGDRALIYQAGDYSEIQQLDVLQTQSGGQNRFSAIIDQKLLIFGALSGNSARVLAEVEDVHMFWPATSIAGIPSHGIVLRRDQSTLSLIRDTGKQAKTNDYASKAKILKAEIEKLQKIIGKNSQNVEKSVFAPTIIPAYGDGQTPRFVFRIDSLDTGMQILIHLPTNGALIPQNVPPECLISKNCIYIQNSAGPLQFDLFPTQQYDDGTGCKVVVYQNEQKPVELQIEPMAFYRPVPRMPDGIVPFITIEIPENISDIKDQNARLCSSSCLLGPAAYVAVSEQNQRQLQAGSINALFSYIQVRYPDMLSNVTEQTAVEQVFEILKPNISIKGLFSRLQVYIRAFGGSQLSQDFAYQAALLMIDLKIALQSQNIDYITNKFKLMESIKLISNKLDGAQQMGLENIRQIFIDAGIMI